MKVGRPKRENGETVTYIQITTSVFDELTAYSKKTGRTKIHITSEAVRKYVQEAGE